MTSFSLNPLRVLLVNPPFQYFPGMRKSTESYTRPPLGIAYLASELRNRAPVPCFIHLVDCEAEGLHSVNQTILEIRAHKPDIVGFSIVTGTCRTAAEIALRIKEQLPQVVTLAGGPHVTALPEEPLPGFDIKVVGEGESSFVEYIRDCYVGGADVVPGCIRFRDGEIIARGRARPAIEPLDRIPIPARDLLRRNAYFHSYPYRGVRDFTTMFTSRGCAFACSFCGNETLWGRKVRFHSLERTYEEIRSVVAQGYNLIFFDDDTFTLNRDRVEAICGHLSANHPDLRWICHVRADTVDRDLLEKMKGAGCVEVQVGVESGDPDVLAKTGKGLKIEAVRRAFQAIREVRLNSWATFILGNDGETTASIRRSIELAKETDPTYASFIVLLPFPGTRIFESYKERGLITTYDWRAYSWHGKPIIHLPGLSGHDLIVWRGRANREFYLRPRKLFQLCVNVLISFSIREMWRNFSAWWTLVSFSRNSRGCACPDIAASGLGSEGTSANGNHRERDTARSGFFRRALYLLGKNARIWEAIRQHAEGESEEDKAEIRRIIGEQQGAWLDFGCGTGRLAAYVPPERYQGLDLDEGRLRIARRMFPRHTFSSSPLDSLIAEGPQFAGVLLIQMLHHVDPSLTRNLLVQIYSVINPGGLCFIREWDIPSPSGHWFHNLCHWIERPVNARRPDDWVALLEDIGFRNVRTWRMRINRLEFFNIVGYRPC